MSINLFVSLGALITNIGHPSSTNPELQGRLIRNGRVDSLTSFRDNFKEGYLDANKSWGMNGRSRGGVAEQFGPDPNSLGVWGGIGMSHFGQGSEGKRASICLGTDIHHKSFSFIPRFDDSLAKRRASSGSVLSMGGVDLMGGFSEWRGSGVICPVVGKVSPRSHSICGQNVYQLQHMGKTLLQQKQAQADSANTSLTCINTTLTKRPVEKMSIVANKRLKFGKAGRIDAAATKRVSRDLPLLKLKENYNQDEAVASTSFGISNSNSSDSNVYPVPCNITITTTTTPSSSSSSEEEDETGSCLEMKVVGCHQYPRHSYLKLNENEDDNSKNKDKEKQEEPRQGKNLSWSKAQDKVQQEKPRIPVKKFVHSDPMPGIGFRPLDSQFKVRSAVDLVTLVMQEKANFY